MNEKAVAALIQIEAVLFVCGAFAALVTTLFSKQFAGKFFVMKMARKSILVVGLFFVPFFLSLQLWINHCNRYPKSANVILISGSFFLFPLFSLLWKFYKKSHLMDVAEKKAETKANKKLFFTLAAATILLDIISVFVLLLTNKIQLFYVVFGISLALAIAMVYSISQKKLFAA